MKLIRISAALIFAGFWASTQASGQTIIVYDAPGAGTANGQGTAPISLYGKGVVCGFQIQSNGARKGFVRAADGAITSFNVPGSGTLNNQGTRAYGMTASGRVEGFYADSNLVRHGYVEDEKGGFIVFDAPGPA